MFPVISKGLAAVSEEWLKATSRPVKPARVDSSVPNVARVWNYLIGGRDNFEADRQAAKQLVAASPVMAQAAPASRAFLRRAVTYLAAEAGVRQFLDIGTGLPTAGNTHEVAQAVDPSCRIVYVDNDPVVLSHARAGLRSSAAGTTSYLDADARDTCAIVAGASATLDLARPVGVIMIDILNFIEDAVDVLGRLAAAVPAGSYLAVMQPSKDERLTDAARRWNQLAETPVFLRDRAQVARWFAGLELVDPGIVEVHQWRPAPGDPRFPDGMPLLGAVARKP
jgi:S-adenosyl methyltransferase